MFNNQPESHRPDTKHTPTFKSLLDLVGVSTRKPFDPVHERDASLMRPVTSGAKTPAPVLSLPELRNIIKSNPESTVIVSDLHGYVELLEHVMNELEIRRNGGNRTVRVGSIGDLIDGRTDGDTKTLQFAAKELDFLVAGNHEVAFMGGPRFGGMPDSDPQQLGVALHELVEREILVAAQEICGVLLTHAGVNTAYARSDAKTTAAFLNNEWQTFLASPKLRCNVLRTPAGLLASSPLRSGGSLSDLSSAIPPGCLWQAWEELLLKYPKTFRQIIGHSPRGTIEASLDDVLINIDAAGYRLGIAVITKEKQVILGSDFKTP